MTARTNPVDVVLASAGTGKTYRLTSVLEERSTQAEAPVPPEAILATTFTVKASGELVERTRGRLLAAARPELAERMLAGRVGTVNAMAGRLLTEFALDAGLSPMAEVIAEDRQSGLFRTAVAPLVGARLAALDATVTRLELDWPQEVFAIVDAARQNDLSPEALARSADQSWEGLAKLLSPTVESADELDAALGRTIREALATLETGSDQTQATKRIVKQLRELAPYAADVAKLPWSTWARLTKLSPGAASRAIVEPLKVAAAAHPRHPRLHADLELSIRETFATAAAAMEHYDSAKRELGLVDFIDQERLVLDMLERPEIAGRLAERLQLLLVDEFQDTSPLQLALFLRLGQIVEHSLWVGDPKQAIYGFRGTDPELVDAVSREVVEASGGTVDYLDTSYRSRSGIVAFTNALFTPAFASGGMDPGRVQIAHADRADLQGQPPPLGLWWLAERNWQDALQALADTIREMLASPDDWPIADGTGSRPLRGEDIAILCRSNDRCAAVAQALSRVGLEVGLERDGLLQQPEAQHAVAALRYIVDPFDHLAVAELLHLAEGGERGTAWLDEWLAGGMAAIVERLPLLRQLDEARAQSTGATPAEVLDFALMASDSLTFAQRLDDPLRRMANLDALRGLAVSFEEECRARRAAATAAGLVTYLGRDVADGGPQPASPSRNAVHVSTYHKAKGLEWPVVILLDLQSEARDRTFGLTTEPRPDQFDVWEPLAGRWLRYWPWPYGKQSKDVVIDARAAESPEGQRARERERSERRRLLYVGMTRARDYLVMAAKGVDGDTCWLDSLFDHDLASRPTLPTKPGLQSIELAEQPFPVRVRLLQAPSGPIPATPQTSVHAPSPKAEKPAFRAYRLRPSGAAAQIGMQVAETVALGGRLPLAGSPDMARLGDALHRFLAADDPDAERSIRLALADRLLSAWQLSALSPDACLIAADRLRAFIDTRYPQAVWRHEWPLTAILNGQRVRGQIDVLLECRDRLAIIDHKSFPGRPETWHERALVAGAQVETYAAIAGTATDIPSDIWVHMPLVGQLMRLERRPEVTAGVAWSS